MNISDAGARAIIVASAIVGLIAYDAFRHRRAVIRFARFMAAYDRPAAPEPEVAHADQRGG